MGTDPYSASKSCAEIIINMYLKSFANRKKIKIVLQEQEMLWGGDWSKDRIIPDLIKRCLSQK